MRLNIFIAIVCIICGIQIIGINGYPLLNIPYLFGSPIEGKYKKNDLGFPQIDADVLELEHLRQQQPHDESSTSFESKEEEMPVAVPVDADTPKSRHVDLLPELERQLESATPITVIAPSTTPSSTSTISTTANSVPVENQKESGSGHHRPPTISQNEEKSAKSINQQQQTESVLPEGGAIGVPSMAKPFYGAARLAFGQNPEVLPTSTTSTSTASSTTTTTKTVDIPTSTMAAATINVTSNDNNDNNSNNRGSSATEITTSTTDNKSNDEFANHSTTENVTLKSTENKEIIGDVVGDELQSTKTASRRSLPHNSMTPKTAKNLLKHADGQYSSFDMAQYVFWTGDEAGVARAVEEFIEQGLMTRENALKFLRDIRMGIEYLEHSYENRVSPNLVYQNTVKKSNVPVMTTTTTTTTSSTTERPFVEQNLLIEPQANLRLAKTLENMSMWNKLQEMNNDARQDLPDYDDTNGRAKITEFLYTEYTLEEILYKLAKVMFTQSLAQGSDEAQRELQKLTDFLEREGNLGVIPIDLQKKVLHVLLTALSDTLSEHPELIPAARLNLINPYNRLPIRTYGAIN